MTKICFVFSGLVNSNGVSKVAIAIGNLLAEREDLDITLIPVFSFEKGIIRIIDPRVHTKKVLGFYFRSLGRWVSLLPYRWLYNWIVKPGHYDIEIGFQYDLPTKIVAASINKNATHIAWMHGYDKGLKMRRHYRKLDKVISVAKYGSDNFRKEMGDDIPPSDFCYNPVDDKKVTYMGAEPIDVHKPTVPLFISVGRHSPEKGYGRLLEIVARLKAEGFHFKLWLVGNGRTHDALLKQAASLGVNDVVTFLGEQTNPHKYTSKADVFICSSFSEGYSTACTEAIMLGVPVITTPVGGGEEIINDSEAGLLTGMDDESLYQGIKKVLECPQLINEWKATLERTKVRFSQQERAKKLNQIIDWAIELHESKSRK